MPKPAMDWTGHEYSCLKVLGKSEEKDSHGRAKWIVKCICGSEHAIDIRDLLKKEKAGRPVSCGCMRNQFISEKNTKHGMSHHPAYGVWHSMIQRCTDPTHRAWKNYGGRGITVCERWLHSFEAFWEDMGPTYQPGLDLDRENNDLGYSPENCRWVSRTTNCRNKRGARTAEIEGRKVPLKEVSAQTGINYTTLLYRQDSGCPPEHLLDKADVRNRFMTSSTPDRDIAM